MTDRFHSLQVILEKDVRSDDAEATMNAIRRIRGVAEVTGIVADMDSNMAQVRARLELGQKLIEVIHPGTK